jgi:hypothetical protein
MYKTKIQQAQVQDNQAMGQFNQQKAELEILN